MSEATPQIRMHVAWRPREGLKAATACPTQMADHEAGREKGGIWTEGGEDKEKRNVEGVFLLRVSRI